MPTKAQEVSPRYGVIKTRYSLKALIIKDISTVAPFLTA